MKKFIRKIAGLLVTIFVVAISGVSVSAAGASLTGPSIVRAGDSIQLKLQIPDAKRYGIEGTLSYDSNQVTLSSVTASMKGWVVEQNGNGLVAYDNELTSPTSVNGTVLLLNFKVKSNVAAGSVVKISITGLTSTDGTNENNYGTVTYSVTIAQPLSGENTLSSLVVAGQTLSPAFSSNITTYNLGEVDYSVSKLNITATPTDSKAKVTVSGNSLAVGKNTVTITVKAENGSTKTYQLTVTRKQDPNYKASSNANISQITLSAGLLSPVFSADIADYIVYLPYEMVGKGIDIAGKAQDAKAVGVKNAKIEALVEGANVATLVCTAEDGSTKEYKVTAYVMPKYEGEIPVIGDDNTETPSETPSVDEEEPTTKVPTEENTTEVPTVETTTPTTDNEAKGNDTWKVIVFVIAGFAAGIGVCFLAFKLIRKNEE